ncbi:hypothetical protein CR513_61174, partial [Mucuna pruriens]
MAIDVSVSKRESWVGVAGRRCYTGVQPLMQRGLSLEKLTYSHVQTSDSCHLFGNSLALSTIEAKYITQQLLHFGIKLDQILIKDDNSSASIS